MVGLEYYLVKSWLKPRIQALGVPHASRGSTLKMPRPRERVCLENGLKPLGTSFSEPSLKGCEQAAHPYRDSREPQRAEIEASSPPTWSLSQSWSGTAFPCPDHSRFRSSKVLVL